jgi:hypothetical protein
LIFATIITLTKPLIIPPPPNATPLWTVVGQISPQSQVTPDNQIACDTDPPPGHVDVSNQYRVSFRKDDKEDFPDVLLTVKPEGRFQNFVIHLDDKWAHLAQPVHFQRDEKSHLITVDPITLVKVGGVGYAPTGPSPSPIPTATPTSSIAMGVKQTQ